MNLSLNTLRLLQGLLHEQKISVAASREDIEAVLAAKDELAAAIAEAEAR